MYSDFGMTAYRHSELEYLAIVVALLFFSVFLSVYGWFTIRTVIFFSLQLKIMLDSAQDRRTWLTSRPWIATFRSMMWQLTDRTAPITLTHHVP